jgi:hypothetical protein
VHEAGPGRYLALFSADSLARGANLFSVDGMDWRGAPLHAEILQRVFPLATGETGSFSVGESLEVAIRARAVIGRIVCIADEAPLPAGAPEGLAPAGSAFRLEMPLDRLREPLALAIASPKDVCLFRRTAASGWRFVGAPAAEEGVLDIRSCSTYAFFRDTIPPRPGRPVLHRRGPRGSGFFMRGFCAIPVLEQGSGVNPYSVSATIGGAGAVCEYDEHRHRLVIPLADSIPRGSVVLAVELADRAGNRSAGEWRFVLE